MMRSWSKRRAFAVSALLILVTNAIALGGVAYNRSGEPRSTLTLTDRELPLAYRSWMDHENSGIDLQLSWRVRPVDSQADTRSAQYRELHWLSDAQKAQLGFAVPAWATASAEREWDPPMRRAFVVLENDGAAYRIALEQARADLAREAELANANPGVAKLEEDLAEARRRLEREESCESRLFVVDVDTDADVLRARYPDRSRYAVVRARLDAYLEREHGARGIVHISELDIPTISVPHAFRALIAPLVPQDYGYSQRQRAGRFEVTVEWGRRFAPSITGLTMLDRG